MDARYMDYPPFSSSQENRWRVCPLCRGRGVHVNPDVDSNGITPEEFYEDPGFEEEYFSGTYDVVCVQCKGNKVVPDTEEYRRSCQEEYEYYLEQESEMRWGY